MTSRCSAAVALDPRRDDHRYRLALACLALCSCVSVSAAELTIDSVTPALLIAVSLVAAVLSLLSYRRNDRGWAPKWVISFAALGAFSYATAEVAFWGRPTVLALSHFFIAVVVLKLIDRTTVRDDSELLVTSLFLMVIGAITSGQLLYGILLTLYVFVGVRTLFAFHHRQELERINERSIASGSSSADRRSFFSAAVDAPPGASDSAAQRWRATALVVACGVMVFLLCPRIGPTALARASTPLAMSVTGFTDAIRFGDLNEIKKNQRVVMRVELLQNGEPIGSPNLQPYFRGMALDLYDGRQWTSSLPGRGADRPQSGEPLIPDFLPDPRNLIVEQRYTLLNPATYYLFAIYVPFQIEFDEPLSVASRRGDRALWNVGSRTPGTVHYTVHSITHLSADVAAALSEHLRAVPLRLDSAGFPFRRPEPRPPPRSIRSVVSDRVKALANEIVGFLPSPADDESIRAAARRIEEHLLSGRYAYTLDRSDVDPNREPVEDFLFHRRRGHCEYFASAMTVLCQLVGIRARVINGYHGGQWNATGGYYVVAEEDAHSWVEVYTHSRDWERFDPTPGGANVQREQDSLWSSLRGVIAHVQVLWADRVVSYSAANRENLLAQFGLWLAELGKQKDLWDKIVYTARELLLGPAALNIGYRLMYWTVILLCLFVLYMSLRLVSRPARLWWKRFTRRWTVRQHRPRTEAFYTRTLDLLAVLGYAKPDTDTPLEHMLAVANADPRLAHLPEIARAYYRIHFGGRQLSPAQRRRVDYILSEISRLTQKA